MSQTKKHRQSKSKPKSKDIKSKKMRGGAVWDPSTWKWWWSTKKEGPGALPAATDTATATTAPPPLATNPPNTNPHNTNPHNTAGGKRRRHHSSRSKK